MKLLDEKTTYDKILAYLEDPGGDLNNLTAHEKTLATRYTDAYTFYRDCRSRSETVGKLMKLHYPLSRAQAYRDVATSLSLFGDAAKMTLPAVRHIMTEGILEAINMARKMGQPGTMIKGFAQLGRAWNVQNPVEETLRDMQPHTYVMNLDPQSLLALSKMLNTGNLDFATFLNNLPIQDADIIKIED